MDWSVIGIILSLAFIVILALRGWHIIVIAPLAVLIVSILSNMNIMEMLTGPYMKGFTNYAGKFYLVFLAGSLFGKFMENGQAARSIANGILKVTGRDSPMRVMLAVSVVALCLTYGGVNLWVVIFAVIPIARPLFKETNLSWHLFMAAFIFGSASITMTMLPGTPSIQNIMPTKYMASTTYSAPLVGLTGAVFVIVFNLLYFRYILRKSKERGETYEEPSAGVLGAGVPSSGPTPNVWLSLVPPIIVLLLLNLDIPYIRRDAVIALAAGVVACIVLFWKYYADIVDTLSKGALNTVVPIVNTCADVGYGMAVAATTGFKLVSSWLLTLPMHPIISLAIATNVMAAITGSASGGLGIIMETLVPKYLALGLSPDLIHRIATMASGAFDAMPHNGAVITMLAVAGLTHKNAYKHFFFGHVVADTIGLILALPVGIWIYG
ncbi:MAG: Na+/H+ antiporter NhaC family protein [Syntrophobacteraceae bacterium]|jgi:H+/gluconate symporter-like permease